MLSQILCSVNYELIEKINLNNMYKYIYILSMTNKEVNCIIKEHITQQYITTIKINIKLAGQNNYRLPGKVLAYVYPNNITVSEDKYKNKLKSIIIN